MKTRATHISNRTNDGTQHGQTPGQSHHGNHRPTQRTRAHDGLHRGRRLGVGKLETGDREHDFPAGEHNVLRHLRARTTGDQREMGGVRRSVYWAHKVKGIVLTHTSDVDGIREGTNKHTHRHASTQARNRANTQTCKRANAHTQHTTHTHTHARARARTRVPGETWSRTARERRSRPHRPRW